MRNLLFLCALCLFASCVKGQGPTCGISNTTNHIPTTDYAKSTDPAYTGSFFAPPNVINGTFTDGLSGCTIEQLTYGNTEVTNAVRHEYSNMSAVNQNSTLIELLTNTPTWFITDTQGNIVVPLGNVPWGGGIGARWSTTDPLSAYYVSNNLLKKATITSYPACKPTCTMSTTTVHDFSAGYNAFTLSIGGGEGDLNPAQPGMIPLNATKTSDSSIDIWIYNANNDTSSAVFNSAGHQYDNASITSSGQMVINWGTVNATQCPSGPCYYGFELFSSNMAYIRSLNPVAEHAKQVTYSGVDYTVFFDNWPKVCVNSGIAAQNNATGAATCILDNIPWNAGVHIGASMDTTGWLVISMTDADNPGSATYPLATNWNQAIPGNLTPNSTGYWGTYSNEIFMVRADGSSLRRMTWHRSRPITSASYWKIPRASISRDGEYVVYDSDYGQGINTPQTDYTDVFVIATGITSTSPVNSISGTKLSQGTKIQ